jgi:hypothetical protein
MFPDQDSDDIKAAFKRSVGTDINNLDNDAGNDDTLPVRSQRGGRNSTQNMRGKKRNRQEQEDEDGEAEEEEEEEESD